MQQEVKNSTNSKRKCDQLNEKIIAVIDSNFAVVERNSEKNQANSKLHRVQTLNL